MKILFTGFNGFNNTSKVIIDRINNDKLFAERIERISNNALEWISKLVEIRNNTLKEINDFSVKISKCKTLNELDNEILDLGQKNRETQNQIKTQIDEMTEKIKEK